MIDSQSLIIIGAGGHAKVVLSVAVLSAEKMCGYLDDNPTLLHQMMSGYPVLGDTTGLKSHDGVAVFGLGNNLLRKKIADEYTTTRWKTLIHPTAYIHPSAKIGKGTVIFAGAVIQPDAIIGDHCIINTGATIDHDCVIGDYVHLAPGVHLAGGVKVAEGTFMGIGSVATPYVQIEEWAQVAAGGVVINNVPAKTTVMGVPAKEKV